VELVPLNLECLWNPTITWMGRQGGRQCSLHWGSHRVLSPVVVVSASKLDGDLDESRHGCFGGDGIVKHYSENGVHRGSTDVAWPTTCSLACACTCERGEIFRDMMKIVDLSKRARLE
jgi:hypothetical protein